MADERNISTAHQPKGSGKSPSDTLDKPAATGPIPEDAPLHPGEPIDRPA